MTNCKCSYGHEKEYIKLHVINNINYNYNIYGYGEMFE